MGAFQLISLCVFTVSLIFVDAKIIWGKNVPLTPTDTELAQYVDCAPGLVRTPLPLEFAPEPLPLPAPEPIPAPLPLPVPDPCKIIVPENHLPLDDCGKALSAPLPLPLLPPQPALPSLPPPPPFQIDVPEPEVHAEPILSAPIAAPAPVELPLLPPQPVLADLPPMPPFQVEVPEVNAEPIIPAFAPQPTYVAQPSPPLLKADCIHDIPLAAPIPVAMPAPEPLPELPPLAPLPPMPPFLPESEPEQLPRVDCFQPPLPEKIFPEPPTFLAPPPPPPQQFLPGCAEYGITAGETIPPPPSNQFLPPPQFTPTYPEKGFIVGEAIAPPSPPPSPSAPIFAPGAYPPHHFVAAHDCQADLSPSPVIVPAAEMALRNLYRTGISHPNHHYWQM